ncbi:HNH endonuclease signature motif containing protein [Corynebacterium sp.]|uniref:HNH endonuclease signature motif containing protein n=1 Tax=Corynebacterium sp. TaxID=1720 RepID=UPI0037360E20
MWHSNTGEAYYAVCSDKPKARKQRLLRQLEYDIWKGLFADTEAPQEVRDWSEYAAGLSADLGVSETMIANNLLAMDTLIALPRFQLLVESLYHANMILLRKIAATLCCDTFWDHPENQAIVDEFLTEFLTPTKPAQVMPGPRAVGNRLEDLLRELRNAPEAEESEPAVPDHYVEDNKDGTFTTSSTWDGYTTAQIDEAIRAFAAKEKISLAQAHARLILEDIDLSVVLNVYKASDVAEACAWMPGSGNLSPEETEAAERDAQTVRDIMAAKDRVTEQYAATGLMRAYINGRDGTCRWPGCNRPATHTDKDHCVDWAKGGPTSPRNLVSLCRHHHNRKTDGLVHYIFEPISGDVYWLFRDGTWVVDEADGLLAPKNARWKVTLNQRKKRRRQKAGPSKQTSPPTKRAPQYEGPPPF